MEVEFRTLKSVFVLYSALNANGYDKENGKQMHPVRLQVRSFLEQQKFTKHEFKWNPYQYTKQVLLSDDLRPTKQTNPDFVESLEYLRRFGSEAKLEEIWPPVETATKLVLDDYRREVSRLIDELKLIMEMEEPSGKIIVSVNLLESYFRGFSISIRDMTYLITGPSGEVNLRNILHELLHAYLKKAVFKYPADAKIYSKIAEDLRLNYPIDTIIEESVVRALVVYLGGKLKIEKATLSSQDKKLIFPEIFLEKLKKLRPDKISFGLLEHMLR